MRQPDLTWDPESTQRFLRSIATESARMERLVGDLLDSTAIESGVLRLQRDWCDLPLVVEAARCCVSEQASILIRIDDELEPIWADHDRIEQVFVNLLENAVSHGRSEDPVEVTIGPGAAQGAVEVEVRDHGPGIPLEKQACLFDRFERAETNPNISGLGLGLYISKQILEAHHGIISVQSEPGKGSTFRFTLPTSAAA